VSALIGIREGREGNDREHGGFDLAPTVVAVYLGPGPAVFADDLTVTDLRDFPLEQINSALAAKWAERVPDWLLAEVGDLAAAPLAAPGRRIDSRFHAHVAVRYLQVMAGGSPTPTKALAEEASVPLSTAQRWVVDARRRGKLPKARRGRAG
jgi:hypothetical protein